MQIIQIRKNNQADTSVTVLNFKYVCFMPIFARSQKGDCCCSSSTLAKTILFILNKHADMSGKKTRFIFAVIFYIRMWAVLILSKSRFKVILVNKFARMVDNFLLKLRTLKSIFA